MNDELRIIRMRRSDDSWTEFLESLSTVDLVKLVLCADAYQVGDTVEELKQRKYIPDKYKLELLLIGCL